jgi:hypothetical protein
MTTTENWPILRVAPCKFTDDDIAFHSDILYFRALLDHIWENAWTGVRKPNPIPITLSDELAGIEKMARTDFDRAIALAEAVTW